MGQRRSSGKGATATTSSKSRRDRAALADSKHRRSFDEYADRLPDDVPASSLATIAETEGGRRRGGRGASARAASQQKSPASQDAVVDGASPGQSTPLLVPDRRRRDGGAQVESARDSCVRRECGTLAALEEEASYRRELDAVLLQSLTDLEDREAAEVARALDLSISGAFESVQAEERLSTFEYLDAASSGDSASAAPSSSAVLSGGETSDGSCPEESPVGQFFAAQLGPHAPLGAHPPTAA